MVRSIFALAAVLSVATASLARDLVTPAVYVGPSTSVACKLLNITSAPVPAQVQLIEVFSGTVLAEYAPNPVPLLAQGVYGVGKSYPNTTVFCRFVNASLSKFRGSLIEQVPTGDGTDTIVIPAQ
jgi:hypothetical protein